MANGPTTWDINEAITIDLLVLDPLTGLGLTGQTSFITLKIRRSSDNKYWTGSAWSSSVSTVSMIEVDLTNEPGRYIYTLSAVANAQADRYFVFSNVNNAPTLVGDDMETHVSRDLSVKVYESEAS